MKRLILPSFLLSLSFGLHAQIMPTSSGAAPATITPAAVPTAYPGSSTINYVRSWQLQKPMADPQQMAAASASDAIMQTQYVDGLGQPLQNVSRASSPMGKDLVVPVIYDALGREVNKYLSYVSTTSDGSFQQHPFQDQTLFMQARYAGQGEQFFYGQVDFEASALNRVQIESVAGNSWAGSGRGMQTSYQVNESNEVRAWRIEDAHASLPTSAACYGPGELARVVHTDENGKRVVEYNDKEGRLVLKKAELTGTPAIAGSDSWLCTYYVYDVKGQLRFVLPPKAIDQIAPGWTISLAIADGLCFRYEYDEQYRMINKKIPGTGETWMVYDARDRLAFVQDANMRTKNWWLATICDALNRIVLTGMITYTGTYASLAGYAADPAHLQGASIISSTSGGSVSTTLNLNNREIARNLYQAKVEINFLDGFESETNAEFIAEIVSASNTVVNYAAIGSPIPPNTDFKTLTQNFYDDYSHTQKNYTNADNSKLDPGSSAYPDQLPATASTATRGLVTGGKVWLLEDAADLSQGQWLENVKFYDALARPVQLQSDNDKGGLDVSYSRFDFTGKVISTYSINRDPVSAASETRVLTLTDYDAQGRVLDIRKKINDQGSLQTIQQNDYDELALVKTKHLGNGLQDLTYEYNIRGWLKSMNKDYVAGTNTTDRFGQVLSYDFGFSKQQYNGNISGVQWRSAGDGEARAYGFDYDASNRLLKADFTQYTGGSWNVTAGVDFSMKMGDGISPSSAYDANGNIKAMSQKGLLLQGSRWIDQMAYTYFSGSNQLQNVVDGSNDPDTRLGDFHTSTLHPQKATKDQAAAQANTENPTITDYAYDGNGNLTTDFNKDIAVSGIEYNYLNLPVRITMQKQGGTKGTITFLYDATGARHRKIVREFGITVHYNHVDYLTNVTTTTSYEGLFVYESKKYDEPVLAPLGKEDELQFFAHEEGRIRPTGNPSVPFAFDYMIKDHQGNVRMLLTDEQRIDKYPVASLEQDKLGVEKDYYQIDESRIVYAQTLSNAPSYTNDNGIGNVPVDPSFQAANSQRLYRLNGNSARTGMGIALKVMSGDKLDVFGKSYYTSSSDPDPVTPNQPAMIAELLQGLMGAIGGTVGVMHQQITAGDLNNLPGLTTDLNGLLGTQQGQSASSGKPQAFITCIFFDEQFRYAGGISSPVGNAGVLTEHHGQFQNLQVPKNGYAYIYCSNESPINVYFDNLQVVHTRGAELEETHYYPFGLVMAGISSSASNAGSPKNKHLYNQGSELQNKEFSDGSGLELYATALRSLDPQLGRWGQIDTKPDYAQSLYSAMGNNPILYSDAAGDTIKPNVTYTYTKTATPVSLRQLAGTTYTSNNISSATKRYVNIDINITIDLSAAFKGETIETSIEVQNPELEKEVRAHEEGHRDQLMEAANKPVHLELTLNGEKQEFDYPADELIPRATAAFLNSTEASKLSSKDQSAFVNNQIGLAVLNQVDNNIRTFAADPSTAAAKEEDANARAAKALGPRAVGYNSYRTPVIFNGKTLK